MCVLKVCGSHSEQFIKEADSDAQTGCPLPNDGVAPWGSDSPPRCTPQEDAGGQRTKSGSEQAYHHAASTIQLFQLRLL